MAWFTRSKQNIETRSAGADGQDGSTRDMPDGIWAKCSDCKEILYQKMIEEHLFTCPKCNKHFRIGSSEYFQILLDDGLEEEIAANLLPGDPLEFKDSKAYTARVSEANRKTHLKEAMRVGLGKIESRTVVLGVMDFSYIGGSMGSVVGEKFSRAIDRAIADRRPYIMISSSGGARMQEAAISLMQLAKTSAKLAQLAEAGLPYISILTDPTTGGVTASFAMLGDVNIAEPKALIAFAGPRVVEQTIRKKLPPGFQRSEFVQEHGFIDVISHRKELKATVARVLGHLA
ncbi:MAG: acetyl-CoA carboxylase, carboxyltransferase subunit beta [Bacteroidota bacterium]|nr:acetyl-CoA carboxylase, carboxyltransferase subunit beta [Bacteroidota bacterium]MDP4233827.1 acetyl-CoA carboxylase, carboxyltransferase subunit beta [Bacteroidota bacterium]